MQTVDKAPKTVKHRNMITLYLVIYDVIVVSAAHFMALWLRFDCHYSEVPALYLNSFLRLLPFHTTACVLIFGLLRLYSSVWRYVSVSELIRVIAATVLTCLLQIIFVTVCRMGLPEMGIVRMPLSYYAFGSTIQLLLTAGIRFSYRFVLLMRRAGEKANAAMTRVLLVGAGEAGQLVLHSLNQSRDCADHVCCLIDDDPDKWGRYIDGVPIVGGRDTILYAAQTWQIDKIIVAIPAATAAQRRDILNICQETGCELKNLPDIYRFMAGRFPVLNALADVTMEDLLGREPVKVNLDEIFQFLKGKTILVTGGGGSIGSELCRQIAAHEPGKLVLFDMYENNIYDIQHELKHTYPDLDLVVLIGSVRDSVRINEVFAKYKPEVVYHAAAHKHVPLMEASPREAIKNNVFGTYKTAYAAMCNGCHRFVLISTDKAVNPTNIMGASKRMSELVIQAFDRMIREHREQEIPRLYAHMNDEDGSIQTSLPENFHAETEFVAVRFGNVLGSSGSVVPLFKKQIAAGGPVTVTHPDIVRYFMTIPEAVSLVLQAGTYAESGTIYVLDMGDEVYIDTLARSLIRLAGLKPDEDIKIEYIGLRPGEKLYEEKLMDEEGLKTTPNKLIYIGAPLPIDVSKFFEQLKRLMHVAYKEDGDCLELVKEIVTTYRSAEALPGAAIKET